MTNEPIGRSHGEAACDGPVRSRSRTAVAVLAALALIAGVLGVMAGPASAVPLTGPVVLDDGHIDLFELTWDEASSKLVLSVKDDTGLYDLRAAYRDPADVVLDVDAATAGFEIPEGLPPEYDFLGASGTTIYLLDEIQLMGLPWPGWSTERLNDTLPADLQVPYEMGAVTFTVEVAGPGEVFTFMNDSNGPINRYVDTVDPAPDVIQSTGSSHAHTAWVFTQQGDYVLTVTPSATTDAGTVLTGDPTEYRVHVGDLLVETPPEPSLTLGADLAVPVVGAPLSLTASADPGDDIVAFEWFRWTGEGYDLVGSGATVETIGLAEATLYTAAAVDANGRIVATNSLNLPAGVDDPDVDPVVGVSISGLAAHYHSGEVASLTAVQDPVSDEDHYHWFTRAAGETDWTMVPGAMSETYGFIVRSADAGTEVIARLYDHDHALIAESAPVVIEVDDHGNSPYEGAVITTTLAEEAGTLVISVDEGSRDVQLSDLELSSAADRYVATGELGGVRVTDSRSDDPGWTARGRVRAFTTLDGATIPGANLGWSPKVLSSSSGQSVSPGASVAGSLSGGPGVGAWSAMGTAAAGQGRGVVVLGADLVLETPVSQAPGTYQGLMILTII